MKYTPLEGFHYPLPEENARRALVREAGILWPSIRVTEDPEHADEMYSVICQMRGRLGGTVTARRYGSEHYRTIAEYRHGRISHVEMKRRLTTLKRRYREERLSNGPIN